jgi:hypothetical protein
MRRSSNLQSFQGLEPEHIPDDGRQDIRHRTFREQVEWVRYISNLGCYRLRDQFQLIAASLVPVKASQPVCPDRGPRTSR